jgi:hypothetical protein
MPNVGWEPVQSDLRAETTSFVLSLRAIMTRTAKGLKVLHIKEQFHVVLGRYNVVDERGWYRHATGGPAHAAEGLFGELKGSEALPPYLPIKLMMRCAWHGLPTSYSASANTGAALGRVSAYGPAGWGFSLLPAPVPFR